MLMVSERWAPLSSCSSSFSRRAVLVWMLFSNCSLRCRISDSSSLRSHEPEGAGFWGASLGPANNDVEVSYRLTARTGRLARWRIRSLQYRGIYERRFSSFQTPAAPNAENAEDAESPTAAASGRLPRSVTWKHKYTRFKKQTDTGCKQ